MSLKTYTCRQNYSFKWLPTVSSYHPLLLPAIVQILVHNRVTLVSTAAITGLN